MITNQTLDEKTKEIVISDFKNFYYGYLEKILKEIDIGDFSHISSFDESDDRIPDLNAMGIIELKHNGKFVEANREYIALIKNSPKVDSSILYSWSKTILSAGALDEAYAVLVFSVKILIALRYEMIINTPFQQTIQLFRLIKIIERENPQELLLYLNMLAGLHSYTDNSDNGIYKFQKKLIEDLKFTSINWNKYLNLEKELGMDFLKKQEVLMKSFGLNL